MTNAQAFARAIAALDKANDEQGREYINDGEGWGGMSSHEIYDHIRSHLANAFKQKDGLQ